MLVRLLTIQIPKFWDLIKYGIQESLGELLTDKHYNNILTGLLKEDLICFVVMEDDKVKANTVVRAYYDDLTEKKSLVIYSAYANKELSNDLYVKIFDDLQKYAKSIHCDSISAFTSMNKIVEMAELVGGDTSQTFISFPLK